LAGEDRIGGSLKIFHFRCARKLVERHDRHEWQRQVRRPWVCTDRFREETQLLRQNWFPWLPSSDIENMTRATVRQLPPLNAVTLLRALFKRSRNPSKDEVLADLQTVFEIEHIDLRQVMRYNALLGFTQDALPITYYYLIAQRAHLSTMLRTEFPFRIAGLIHVENDVVEHVPVNPRQALRVTTNVRIGPRGPSGARHCTLETIAEQQGRRVFTCTSRYLAASGQRMRGPATRIREDNAHPLIGKWVLAPSAGRQYAAVSGDWNPIHLWNWSARLMGLETPIIHGMHTMGKACAVLENELGRRVIAISGRFKAPVPLGGEACLQAETATGSFVVICNGRRAVDGKFQVSS
jgi:hypothetical protein